MITVMKQSGQPSADDYIIRNGLPLKEGTSPPATVFLSTEMHPKCPQKTTVFQVTNPAIDPFRESVVTSLRTFIGPEGDLSEVSPEHCYRMELEQPILSLRQMSALKRMDFRGWHANVIDTTFDKSLGEEGIQKTLRRVCKSAERAISWGYQILVRSCCLVGVFGLYVLFVGVNC